MTTFSADSKLIVWNLMTPVLGSVTSLYMLMFNTTPLTWEIMCLVPMRYVHVEVDGVNMSYKYLLIRKF